MLVFSSPVLRRGRYNWAVNPSSVSSPITLCDDGLRKLFYLGRSKMIRLHVYDKPGKNRVWFQQRRYTPDYVNVEGMEDIVEILYNVRWTLIKLGSIDRRLYLEVELL